MYKKRNNRVLLTLVLLIAGLIAGLIILKAFTKLYGMAGVRLGYCLCPDAEMAEKIRLGQANQLDIIASHDAIRGMLVDIYM